MNEQKTILHSRNGKKAKKKNEKKERKKERERKKEERSAGAL